VHLIVDVRRLEHEGAAGGTLFVGTEYVCCVYKVGETTSRWHYCQINSSDISCDTDLKVQIAEQVKIFHLLQPAMPFLHPSVLSFYLV
jgi:hypothetical protein